MKKGQNYSIFIGVILSLFFVEVENVHATWASRECFVVVEERDPPASRDRVSVMSAAVMNMTTGSIVATYAYNDGQFTAPFQEFRAYYYDGTWHNTGSVGYTVYDYITFSGVETVSSVPAECPAACAQEMEQADSECGFGLWDWTDEANCQYKCEPPPECTESEIAAAVSDCGSEENIEWKMWEGDPEFPQCNYECKDNVCEEDYAYWDDYCAAGVKSYDESTCSADCVGCNEYYDDVSDYCSTRGGIYSFECEIVDSTYSSERKIDIDWKCNSVEEIPPDTPPEDTENPADNPPEDEPDNEDPADDPIGDPDDGASGWLKGIKKNTDTLVQQNNERETQLDRIGDNTKTVAENQGKIQEEISSLRNTVREGDDRVVEAIKGLDFGDIQLDLGLENVEKNTLDTANSLAVEQGNLDTFSQSLETETDSAVTAATSEMETAVGEIFDSVQSVEAEDAGFFQNLIVSVIPPSSTCQPLDMSFQGHTLLIGCERSDEVKLVLSYLVYILTVISVFTLIRKELKPNA